MVTILSKVSAKKVGVNASSRDKGIASNLVSTNHFTCPSARSAVTASTAGRTRQSHNPRLVIVANYKAARS